MRLKYVTPVVLSLAALLMLEVARPLRRQRHPRLRRTARNLSMAALSALVLQEFERPIILSLCRTIERRGWGLLQLWPLPKQARFALAVLLMDYTLYVWHVLTHKVPLLWRFHQAHHIDLDLDASTALRFHFGEIALSIPYRAAQVALLGIDRRSFSLWQTCLLPSILFHHSNLCLPRRLEAVLGWIIVTPRMHGIHHSTIRQERDSNWSSGLAIWDVLHGTLRRNVPQAVIEVGLEPYRAPADVTLGKILAVPFVSREPSTIV